MKTVFISIILFCHITAAAQPVLIAEDKIGKKEMDGYQQGYLVDEPKAIDGQLYFTTPSFRLYCTDGTAAGTKILFQFPEGMLVYIKAVTRKYIYYTIKSYGSDMLKRMDRITLKEEQLTNQQKPLVLQRAYSAVFTGAGKDVAAVRMYDLDAGITQLLSFSDNGPAEAKLVMANLRSENHSQLNNFSNIAFLESQIFYNGFENKIVDGKSVFEYTILSSALEKTTTGQDYVIKNSYHIRSQGYELKDALYTINDSLFTMGFFHNKETKTRDFFVGAIHPKTLTVPATIATDQNFAWAQVLDNQLYVVNGTRLLNWVPGSNNITELYRKRTYQYQYLQPYNSLLKCGNFMVFREEDSLRTFNLQTKKFDHVVMPEKFMPPNSLFKFMDNYVWTTDKFIYYVRYDGLVISLIQYNPVTKEHTPVVFPTSKDERFDSFLSIFQTDGKLLLTTKYIGKKNKPLYKLFLM